jgi:sialidase-1
MRRRIFLTAAAAAMGPRVSGAPRARIESVRIISPDAEFYHGWPTLARRQEGELLVTYSGGRESHICPFGRVEVIRSQDNGESWSWPTILMDSPIDDRDAGVCETPAGSLLVTTFTSLAYESVPNRAQNPARWQAANRRTSEEQRQRLLGTWMLRSTDKGMTWSAPYRVPVNSPHGPVVLSDGRLLYAGKQLWDAGRKVGVCESRDDGRTWRWLADIPARPGDKVEDYHELHAVHCADARILVHIRNHNAANRSETLQCESSDGGRTWAQPHPIGVWGLPSHLLRLRDGRILMTYGHRRAPFGNQARVSEDHGRTWSEPMILSGDGSGGDLGYPSTVEMPDGRLVTVWYESMKDSPRAVLRMARWAL